MMSNIRDWYIRNQDSITWWLIGWLSFSFFDCLLRENYVWAGITALMIWLNYKFIDVRMS